MGQWWKLDLLKCENANTIRESYSRIVASFHLPNLTYIYIELDNMLIFTLVPSYLIKFD